MKAELKNLLTEYFDTVNKRQQECKIPEENKKDYELKYGHISEKLHIVAIGILKDMKWDFEKDRTSSVAGDQLSVSNKILELRRYKCRGFYAVAFDGNESFMPNEFNEMIHKILEVIEESKLSAKENNDEYASPSRRNYSGGYTHYSKKKDDEYLIKLRADINVTYIDGTEIKTEKIKELSINEFDEDIKADSYSYTWTQSLYNDELYSAVKKLIKMHKDKSDIRKEMLKERLREVDKIIKKYNFNEYLVLEGI